MSGSEETFQCPRCKAGYAWSEKLAGRKVACRCGQVFVAPVGRAPMLGRPDVYDAAADTAPQQASVSSSRPAPPAASATSTTTDVMMKYGLDTRRDRRRRAAAEEEGEEEQSRGGVVRNFVLPGVFLAAGLTLLLMQVTWKEPEIATRFMIRPFGMLINVVLGLVAMLGSAYVAALVLKLNLGKLPIAAFKLVSIMLLGGSLALGAARFDQDRWSPNGPMVGLLLMVICYWILFWLLFKMEFQETMLVVAIVSLAQILALMAVMI